MTSSGDLREAEVRFQFRQDRDLTAPQLVEHLDNLSSLLGALEQLVELEREDTEPEARLDEPRIQVHVVEGRYSSPITIHIYLDGSVATVSALIAMLFLTFGGIQRARRQKARADVESKHAKLHGELLGGVESHLRSLPPKQRRKFDKQMLKNVLAGDLALLGLAEIETKDRKASEGDL